MGQNQSTYAHTPNSAASTSKIAEEDKECPICLEEINKENEIVTPCGHEFCKVCIYKWLDKAEGGKRKCPICNYEISRDFLKTASASKSKTKAKAAHSRRSEQTSQAVVLPPAAAAPVYIQRRLPLNMYGFSCNSFRSRNGRLILNREECQDGMYQQDGLKITIEKGIFTSIDQKGKKTSFGGNISGTFLWNTLNILDELSLIALPAVTPVNNQRLPINMFGYNHFESNNGRLVLNNIECQNGIYKQDELDISIENGIFTAIDKKGKKTSFGGNIFGGFSWKRKKLF